MLSKQNTDLLLMETEFKSLLNTLWRDTQVALRAYYALKVIQKAVSRNIKIRRRLNENGDFWNTVMSSLQNTYFIALGRIFDDTSPNNIQKLLKFCEDHLEIFSTQALKKRVQKRFKNEKDLEAYIQKAYVPTCPDFRRLGRLLRTRRKQFKGHYQNIRHKIYAHSELTSENEIKDAFQNAKVGELEDILLFLQRLNSPIRMLFVNGHKPALTRQRLPWKKGITHDTEKFLKKFLW